MALPTISSESGLSTPSSLPGLSKLCCKQIKDNFWYGIFGNLKLVIDKKTGYFNATKLCSSGGKKFDDWLFSEEATDIMSYYSTNPQFSIGSIMYKVVGNNLDDVDKQITGTYVYEKLLLHIAMWISIEFYDKCFNITENHFIQDFKNLKTKEHREKPKCIKSRLNELKTQNAIYKPYTQNSSSHNVFAIVKISGHYTYYVIATQNRNFERALRDIINLYPECDVVYTRRDPNTSKLYKLMVEELGIDSKGNYFNSPLMCEKELLECVDELYNDVLRY